MKSFLNAVSLLLLALALPGGVKGETAYDIPKPSNPTAAVDHVKALFTDYHYSIKSPAHWENWGGIDGFESCVYTSDADDHMWRFPLSASNAGDNVIGIAFPNIDVSDCQYIEFDVYAEFTQVENWGSCFFNLSFISGDNVESSALANRTNGGGDAPAYAWKTQRFSLSDFENLTANNVYQMKIVTDKTYDYVIYIDNIRFVSDNKILTGNQLQVTYTVDGTTRGPITGIAGAAQDANQHALSNALDGYYGGTGSHTTYSYIRIEGAMDATDLGTLQWLSQAKGVQSIDLSGATLPSNKIPDNEFANNTTLSTLVLPNTLTTIGNRSFSNCTALTSVTLPTTLTTIEPYAFAFDGGTAGGLTSITFRTAGNLSVGEFAFQHNMSLQSITVADGTNIDFGQYAFMNIDDYSDTRDYEGNGTALTSLVFAGNNTVTFSGEGAFQGNRNLNTTVGSNVTIEEIPLYTFQMCDAFTNESLYALLNTTGLKKIGNYAFFNQYNTEYPNVLTLPSTIESIGMAAFGISPFREIHVNSATAPTIEGTRNIDGTIYNVADAFSVNATTGAIEVATEKYNNSMDPFAGVTDPNYTTLYFDGDAATGANWKSYLYKDTSNENGDLNLPWARLLTKDLSTASTTYDAYPQQHAIVRLHRTLKAGWNSLCLPFGANYAAYERNQAAVYNAQVFKNALNAADGSNFMLAVYRGYYKEGNLFRFLKYSDYGSYPIDPFEAIMVRMDAGDINAAPTASDGQRVFTFRNVDLNYRYTPTAGDNIGYTGAPEIFNNPSTDNTYNSTTKLWSHNVVHATPQKRFEGNLNGDLPPFNDGHSNYEDYIFTGTFTQFVGTTADTQVKTLTSNGGTLTANSEGYNNEGYVNLNDGNVYTKYCTPWQNPQVITYASPEQGTVTSYSLTSANDSPERDPKAWTLEGSNDNATWTVIDTQTNQTFDSRYQTKTYNVSGAAAYKYYRLNVSEISNAGEASFQLAEWEIKAGVHLITSHDYFMQNETDGTFFYPYADGLTYGVRGFSGWFKYVGEEAAAPAKVGFFAEFASEDGEATEIVALDGNGDELPLYDVYTLDGQQLRARSGSLSGLSKGIYIVNGKKVVVK